MIDVGMNVSFEFKELATLATAKKALALGLADGAEHLLDESSRIAPLDEGTLIASGYTDVDVDKMKARVGYDTKYATRLHENPQYNFQNNRQGKYLEEPMEQNTTAIQEYVAKKMRSML